MNEGLRAAVATPQALVQAIYRCISGPAGAVRDWDGFRFLHHPRATSPHIS